MRRYETIFIIDPDLSADERAPLLERIKDLIPQQGGLLIMVDEWGAQKLAYEIKKKARGYYVLLDYCGTGAHVDEIERLFRIDDRILKYMSVLLEKDVDLENVKEEIARTEAKDDQSDESEIDQETSDVPESEAIESKINDESEVDQETSDVPESEAIESETIQPESNEEEL
jgi:small subunit ribosomal protein S6